MKKTTYALEPDGTIRTFPSANEAAQHYGLSRSAVNSSAQRLYPTYHRGKDGQQRTKFFYEREDVEYRAKILRRYASK